MILKKIQHWFLKVAYKSGQMDVLQNIFTVEFGLKTLASRWLYYDLTFVTPKYHLLDACNNVLFFFFFFDLKHKLKNIIS